MHWSEEIAKRVIERNPNKEEYVCAAGISPSGSIHIGNFRDVVTSYFVVRALQKMGKKARLLFSWDEYDRCRKIPATVAARFRRTSKPLSATVMTNTSAFRMSISPILGERMKILQNISRRNFSTL